MPESVSTNSFAVAHVFAAVELLRMLPAAKNNTPASLTANYAEIYKALRDAYRGKK